MFKLAVVTPEQIVYEDKVSSIIAPGSEGYLGIMSNHAPIITALQAGKLTIKDSKGQEIVLAVSSGFLENSNNETTILADAAEFPDDINLERAREAAERAKQRLRDKSGNIDFGRARRAYERARNRIHIASK
jgi:F-type H+-transporting ATPase subunit epsilon